VARRVVAAATGIVIIALVAWVVWPDDGAPARTPKAAAAPAVELVPAPTVPPPLPPRWGAVALVPDVPIFDGPGTAASSRTLNNPTDEGIPRVFSVLERQGDWLKVLLNVRPNSSTGWIRAADVQLHETPYRILVDRGNHSLTLFQGRDVVFTAPVATGTGRTPTPVGTFYVDAIVPTNPNSVWGVFQLSVSGFSEVHKSFMGGSGQIAIHGTNRPGLIGQDVSNGCVRMRNADITEVANRISLGTPVDIVN
jgi:lipoprotein-anchoring transpeptidase ErfK/SrfK